MNENAAVLRSIPGLADVDSEVLTEIANHFRRRPFKDEVICREGEAADTLWVLAKGDADVVKRSEAGRDFVVATLSPVCLFGHVGLFTSSGRTATIRARGAVEVLQMSSTQAHLLLRTSTWRVSGPFRRALIIALSQQLTAATQTLWRLAEEMGATEPASGASPSDAERRLLKANSHV